MLKSYTSWTRKVPGLFFQFCCTDTLQRGCTYMGPRIVHGIPRCLNVLTKGILKCLIILHVHRFRPSLLKRCTRLSLSSGFRRLPEWLGSGAGQTGHGAAGQCVSAGWSSFDDVPAADCTVTHSNVRPASSRRGPPRQIHGPGRQCELIEGCGPLLRQNGSSVTTRRLRALATPFWLPLALIWIVN